MWVSLPHRYRILIEFTKLNVGFKDNLFYVYKKVKCFCYRPRVAQRVGRGIALLFHDRGTRRG